jgi:ATP-dependent Clp protease ATP-binding subunit ClpA
MVCTSNIGSQLLRPTRLPFTALERAVIAELHRFFRPELIGRFDEKMSLDHFLRKCSVRLGALQFLRNSTDSMIADLT